jgi:hypothetical protein
MIDLYLIPTFAVFQQSSGVNKFYILISSPTSSLEIKLSGTEAGKWAVLGVYILLIRNRDLGHLVRWFLPASVDIITNQK